LESIPQREMFTAKNRWRIPYFALHAMRDGDRFSVIQVFVAKKHYGKSALIARSVYCLREGDLLSFVQLILIWW